MTAEITFSPVLAQIFSPNDSFALYRFLFLLALWFALNLGPLFLLHFLFSLPVRRAERARLFLDLIEDALRRGQSTEEMAVSVAQSRDRSLGVRFHLLAAYLEGGMRLGEALKKVPYFLPPQISGMLRIGEKLGDMRRVLPACREIIRDRPAGVRSAIHYMLLVVIFFSPVFVGVVILTATFVLPRFEDVAAGMGVKLWPETLFVFGNVHKLMVIEIVVSALLIASAVIYIGGPRFVRLFQSKNFPVVDGIAWHISWKRKRLQRTFSAMLAVLLDSGVPEAEAVQLAGDCTANEVCRRRALNVVGALQQGAKLTDAMRSFDETGEFHWRLTNAAHARGGFLAALKGWHEALDARAFRQEETTAHVVTSGIVILNGALVALIAIAIFGLLVAIIQGGLSL